MRKFDESGCLSQCLRDFSLLQRATSACVDREKTESMNLYGVMVSFDVEREKRKKTNTVLTRNTFVIPICTPPSLPSSPSFPCWSFSSPSIFLSLVLFASNLNDCYSDDDMKRHRLIRLPTEKDVLSHLLEQNEQRENLPGTFHES